MKFEVTETRFSEYKNTINRKLGNKSRMCFLFTGTAVIRILCFSSECFSLLKLHLAYSIRDNSDRWDYTIILWKENDFTNLYSELFYDLNPATNLRYRVELLALKSNLTDIEVSTADKTCRLELLKDNKTVTFYDTPDKTVYYGINETLPERFAANGHFLVQILYRLLKTENTSLVHGACIGYRNKGILFCAKGCMGKSTLTVLSLLKGCEYVSDDYLVLKSVNDRLYAYPLYSIITLSPVMYDEMYDYLEGTRFVSNNWNKEKYVINISNLHDSFRTDYPIEICMFPDIVSDKEPSVRLCTEKEKNEAVSNMTESTLTQMHDSADEHAAEKIRRMLQKYAFYKLNLCRDIHKNTECLKKFSETL